MILIGRELVGAGNPLRQVEIRGSWVIRALDDLVLRREGELSLSSAV